MEMKKAKLQTSKAKLQETYVLERWGEESESKNGRGRGRLSPSRSFSYMVEIQSISSGVDMYLPIPSGGRLIFEVLH